LRHRIASAQLQHLIERRSRRLHVEQIAVEDHPLLEQEIDAAVGIGGPIERTQLEVEQLDDGIGSPAITEELARGGQSLGAKLRCDLPHGSGQSGQRLGIVRIVFEDRKKVDEVGHGVLGRALDSTDRLQCKQPRQPF
jgi:hypothetical protein